MTGRDSLPSTKLWFVLQTSFFRFILRLQFCLIDKGSSINYEQQTGNPAGIMSCVQALSMTLFYIRSKGFHYSLLMSYFLRTINNFYHAMLCLCKHLETYFQ